MGEERRKLLLSGYGVSVLEDEKFLEMDSGDHGTIIRMDFMPLNCTLKMVNFIMYTLPQFWKADITAQNTDSNLEKNQRSFIYI